MNIRHTEIDKSDYLDIQITEECAFCRRSFTRLRHLLNHDKSCKVKEGLKKKQSHLNPKQHLAFKRKESLRKDSNNQLNQQLSIIANIKLRESPGGGDTGNRSNELGTGLSRKGTPEPAVSKSHNSGEGDEGSSESGSSTIFSRVLGCYMRLVLDRKLSRLRINARRTATPHSKTSADWFNCLLGTASYGPIESVSSGIRGG